MTQPEMAETIRALREQVTRHEQREEDLQLEHGETLQAWAKACDERDRLRAALKKEGRGGAMKKKSPETLIRTMDALCRDPEWTRLANLASAMECAHHALCTVAGLLDDRDFGATTHDAVMAEADLLYRRCQQVRARAQALEVAAIAAAKAASE